MSSSFGRIIVLVGVVSNAQNIEEGTLLISLSNSAHWELVEENGFVDPTKAVEWNE